MPERVKALVSISLCMLFWGVSFVSTRIVLEAFPPMTIGAFRFILACGVLGLIKMRQDRGAPRKEKLALRDLPALAGAGLLGVTLYFWFENTGLSLISASEASIITGAIPVLAMACEEAEALLRRGRRGTARRSPLRGALRWAGALVSMTGVWLVAKVSFGAGGSLKGYLLMGGACVSWVAYNFFIRTLSERRSRVYVVFWQSAAGLAGFIPFTLAEIPFWKAPSPAVIGHLLFLGLLCSALAYWLYARAISSLGIGLVTMFINFIPVVTALSGIALLGERLSPLQWLGAALVIGGVVIVHSLGSSPATSPNET
ncbi:MAG: DMT family transporter [Treponema sp.]|jgi:drug/metabolite transporter (DMT)-like permease|nr:DMT family transporter [Treponema sp.]